MIQMICDRCGRFMKPYDAARRLCSHIKMTDAVLEDMPYEHIMPLWDESERSISICPDCKITFDEWMRDGKRHDH